MKNPNLSQPVSGCESLSDIGISYDQSSKWQKIANIYPAKSKATTEQKVESKPTSSLSNMGISYDQSSHST